ncbi:terminase family protein [Sphingomonas rosea]|uniref:Terminase family protein n=1 Tax=Sphingomonas rosea TaxID=335605 RepID=A0ABP7UGT6_9SPHN
MPAGRCSQPGHGPINDHPFGPAEDQPDEALRPWSERAHAGQLEPEGDHDQWLILAGRGFGKTQAGAEWLAEQVLAHGKMRIALISATVEEARDVMVLGATGIMTIRPDVLEKWVPSRGEIHFVGGSIGKLFSGANPERLRGFQFHLAWCDELAKWRKAEATWDNLQFALRLGERPKALITTTPSASPILADILAARNTATTRGTTFDNPHLGAVFVRKMKDKYGATHKGKVELYGELPPPPGALWTPEMIAESREGEPDGTAMESVAIGVDPPARDGTCGIVVCGRDVAGNYHVLDDHSIAASSPKIWSSKVADAARSNQDRLEDGRSVQIVAEGNQGGSMVRDVILQHEGDDLSVGLVHAAVNKSARAEPIAILFERGKVRMHRSFPELERQLCGLIAGGGYEGPGSSPDRADAMVWALTKLSDTGTRRRVGPGIRSFDDPPD